jgi:hypothetical protein
MQKQLKSGGGRVDERSESTKATIEAPEAGWWMTALIGRCRSPSDRRAAPHPPYERSPCF